MSVFWPDSLFSILYLTEEKHTSGLLWTEMRVLQLDCLDVRSSSGGLSGEIEKDQWFG